MVWIVVVIAVYMVFLFGIAWLSLHPFRTPQYLSPSVLNLPQEEIRIDSDGSTLRGWWVEAPNPQAVVVLMHGYMMNRCELLPEVVHLKERGISCLLLDQRAHGKSGGKKSGLGFREQEDVYQAVIEAKRRCPQGKVGLYGSSMGSAASVFAASSHPGLADFLILDSCYGRLDRAINGWWRFLGGKFLCAVLSPSVVLCAPLAGLNPFKVSVTEALKLLDPIPILFLHGDQDNLAEPKEASANFESARGPKEFVWFEGCGHSEGRWEQCEKYRAAVSNFLAAHDIGRIDP